MHFHSTHKLLILIAVVSSIQTSSHLSSSNKSHKMLQYVIMIIMEYYCTQGTMTVWASLCVLLRLSWAVIGPSMTSNDTDCIAYATRISLYLQSSHYIYLVPSSYRRRRSSCVRHMTDATSSGSTHSQSQPDLRHACTTHAQAASDQDNQFLVKVQNFNLYNYA